MRFPSRPNHGERILRVFCNVNPRGDDRVWRVGETFESMARRLLPRVRPMYPGEAQRWRRCASPRDGGANTTT